MSETVVMAAISLIGTVIGAVAGVATSARLTQYRLKALEQREEDQNQMAEQITEKLSELEGKLYKMSCRMESQSKDLKRLMETTGKAD